MQHVTWNRRYIDGEGWYVDQATQSGRLPWKVELTYGPFIYDEMVDALEWIVFGYLELALAQLDDHVDEDQEEKQQ